MNGCIKILHISISMAADCSRADYHCCYNQYLNNTTKECSDCPAGSIGWNCIQKCPLGYYGRLCQSPCECQASNCHHVIGCTTAIQSENTFSSIPPDVGHHTSVSEYTNNHSHLQNKLSSTQNMFTVSKWMNKMRITSSLYSARRQDLYVEHDTNTWIAVSCSLIGSLVTLILIGCLLYFRSRSKLKMKHPKRIGRILSTSTAAGRNLDLPEGHFELSALTKESPCEDDDTYAEIRVSQIVGACAASCMDKISKNKKCCKISKEPDHKRNTNLYEKCSFETEYDQINLKMKSSLSPSLHNERKVITVKDQGIDVLSSQKEFEVHSESFTSLTLPPSLKRFRTKGNNEFKPQSSSLHHTVSENEFYKQDRKDEEENYAGLNQAKHMTISGPNVKEEEDRPYRVVYFSSYNDLNSKGKVRPGKGSQNNAKSEENVLKSELNQAKHIAASDPNVKEEEDRPYSVVHLSSYNDVNSKERMRLGIGFHSNAKPKQNVSKSELNHAKHIAASDPNVKEDEDRPYSVVHLSSYDDLNSKERVKQVTGFPINAKPKEKVLKPEIGEVKHMAASDPNEKV